MTESALHPDVARITARIARRSSKTRGAYLDLIRRARDSGVDRS